MLNLALTTSALSPLNAILAEQTDLYLRLDVLNTVLSGRQRCYSLSIKRRRERKERRGRKARSEDI